MFACHRANPFREILFVMGTERPLTHAGYSLHSSVSVRLNLSHTKLSSAFCTNKNEALQLRLKTHLLRFWLKYEEI